MKTHPAFPTRLTGRTLMVIRVGWLVVAALTLVSLVVNLCFLFAELQTPCVTPLCLEEGLQLTPEAIAELQAHGLTLRFYAAYHVGLYVVYALVFGAIAALIFWQRSEDGVALFFSLCLLLLGGLFPGIPLTLKEALPVVYALTVAGSALNSICFYVLFLVFPNGRFVPGWTRWLALALIPYSLLLANWAGTSHEGSVQRVNDFVFPLFLLLVIGAQVYRYRWVSSAIERRQTRWVLFGLTVGLGGILALVVYATFLNPAWQHSAVGEMQFTGLIYSGFLLVPLSIGVAIVRTQLYDIDLLIRRTLQYSLLTATLALVYFGSVVLLQLVFRGLTGQAQSQFVTVFSTLTIAALFTPVRRRVQAGLDRRFFRRNYDAAQVLASFAATCREEVKLEQLTDELQRVIQETMQPARVSLWLRPPKEEGKSGKKIG
jgi:hypothetical protein